MHAAFLGRELTRPRHCVHFLGGFKFCDYLHLVLEAVPGPAMQVCICSVRGSGRRLHVFVMLQGWAFYSCLSLLCILIIINKLCLVAVSSSSDYAYVVVWSFYAYYAWYHGHIMRIMLVFMIIQCLFCLWSYCATVPKLRLLIIIYMPNMVSIMVILC